MVGGTSSSPFPLSACIATSRSMKSGLPSAASTIRAFASSGTSLNSDEEPLGTLFLRERLKRDENCVRARLRPARATLEKVGTGRAEEEQRHFSGEGRDVLDQVEQRRLGPMDVV